MAPPKPNESALTTYLHHRYNMHTHTYIWKTNKRHFDQRAIIIRRFQK